MAKDSRRSARGRFVVLDGPDGAGKSTQAKLLVERLRQRGLKVLLLREPGGTETGEAIRKILLEHKSGGVDHLAPLSEAFLFQAARAQLIQEVVKPALESGAWVICDRFTLSTLVYQGYAGGVELKTIEALSAIAAAGVKPDRYLVVWVPPEVGISRRNNRGAADRMESKGEKFTRDVSSAFKKAAQRQRRSYRFIDGAGSIDEVGARIWKQVEPLLK